MSRYPLRECCKVAIDMWHRKDCPLLNPEPPQTFTLEQVEAAVRKAGRIPEMDSPWFDAFRAALTGGGNG